MPSWQRVGSTGVFQQMYGMAFGPTNGMWSRKSLAALISSLIPHCAQSMIWELTWSNIRVHGSPLVHRTLELVERSRH